MKKLCTALAVLCLLCGGFLTTPALAAQADQAGKPQPDKPAKADARVTAVTVIAEGTDSIGAKLVTGLKEAFNQSNLFALNEKDEPKLQLLVTTQPEFPSRPNVGSVYSVCWVFKQGEGYLGFLLARELGTINSEDIDALVAKLVERSDGIAVKYGNLWKQNVLPLKKAERETAAQRRPAQTERQNRVFSAKRQTVWLET